MSVLEVALAVALTATPAPGGQVSTPDPELVTPGTIGFLVTFAVAVALFLLVRDMNRRVQRIQVRGIRADGATGATRDDPGTPGADRDDPPAPGADPAGR